MLGHQYHAAWHGAIQFMGRREPTTCTMIGDDDDDRESLEEEEENTRRRGGPTRAWTHETIERQSTGS